MFSIKRLSIQVLCAGLLLGAACGKDPSQQEPERKAGTPLEAKPVEPQVPPVDAAALMAQAKALFSGPLPERAENPANPATEAKIVLGRMLYFDTRLSKNHDISCNSCHSLADYGIDVRAESDKRQTSTGHKSALGDRNSPTVYNAALHFRQFWDGRAENVEEQAKGPVLNPVEMAMPNDKSVVAVLKTIPGYIDAFKTAFPEDKDPVTYENMAKAIGVFERGLMTPGRFDAFLAGQADALSNDELHGLKLFIDTGCTACHLGTAVGGTMYQKLGLIKPYETKDPGRFKVTQDEADKLMFKVPSLRNIAETGPYLHDGSIATLDQMVRIMAEHQTARGTLTDTEVASIVAFLKSLTGELRATYIAQPELPASGPKTPAPDPS